ncbi:hypothetical protein ATANTOWER_000299 [Ataeniobius toweri]|uniref:Uncharacterized protein n=1 Tax=Ataeniobius toweri TaxID=208326 RepID=A0ABU7BMC5_9TELE|nr:hypothetical protein [Ataeniobius toweri]
MNRHHTPILFLVLFRRGSWMNRLRTPILFLVLFRRGSWINRLAEGPSSLCAPPWVLLVPPPAVRSAVSEPLAWVPVVSAPHHGAPPWVLLIACPYVAGLLIAGSARDGPLIACPYVASTLITCPYVAGLLIAGSAGDGPQIGGSAGDGHRITAETCSSRKPPTWD